MLQYKEANEDFPHQSTGDQFFDEPQFESYRMLGWHIMNNNCRNYFDDAHGSPRPSYDLSKAQFVRAACENYGGTKPIPWLNDLRADADWLGPASGG